MKIGFIGLGNMGASLAKAVLQAKMSHQILLANRSQAKVEAFIANYGGLASSNDEIFAEADVIFLESRNNRAASSDWRNDLDNIHMEKHSGSDGYYSK